jgi:hypothetical protein
MNRHRQLLDAERTVLCEMASGVVGGRYTYWCRKGEVNLKLCSQYETLIFYECVYRTATPLRNLQFCCFIEAGEFTYPSFARGVVSPVYC